MNFSLYKSDGRIIFFYKKVLHGRDCEVNGSCSTAYFF